VTTNPLLRRLAGLLLLAGPGLSCAGAAGDDAAPASDAFIEADALVETDALAPSDALDTPAQSDVEGGEVDDARQPWTPDALWAAYDPARCPTLPDGFDAGGFDAGHALLSAGGEHGVFVDRLFYLFTVLARDPSTRGTLRSVASLAAIADDRSARVAAALGDAPGDAVALVDALRWTDADVAEIGAALASALAPGPGGVVGAELRPSGVFMRYASEDDVGLLRNAWEDAARGINRLLGDYGVAAGSATVDEALSGAPIVPGEDLFFEPALRVAIASMAAVGRDEPVRYEPLVAGENAAALARMASLDWDAWPYSLILLPGLGPNDPDTALTEGGKWRCDQGYERWAAGLAPFIATSGGHVHPFPTPYCEALEMKRYLMQAHGVPEDAILIDPYARHTTTNVRNVSRQVLRYGIPPEKPILCTSDIAQHLMLSALGPRCTEELGYPCYDRSAVLTTTDNCFVVTPAVLYVDVSDPLDP
jgi:hypothetical protein